MAVTKRKNRATIFISPPLMAVIGDVPKLSSRLAVIADRYTEILRRARIDTRFSEAEFNAIYDCCNGTWFEPAQLIVNAVLANFDDSLIDGLAEKWEIDAGEVIAKLRALTYADQVALVEKIEQFWRGVEK